MDNPFFYGAEVSGAYFTDREQETKDLLSDLSRGQNVILYSPRRYGKTSLIKKVLDLLAKKGFLTFYVNLYAATSKKKFIEIYARAIAQGTKSRLEQTIEQLKHLLPHLIPRIVLKPPGLPEIEFDYGRKTKNLSPLLNDLYQAIEKYANKKKKKAIVVFDEFQEILNLEDDEIERSMREHVQSQQHVTYAFLGSKKHLMEELFEHPDRPFYKSGRMFPLQKINTDDFHTFIQKKFRESHISLTPEHIEKILQATECHPYYTQMLCSILWDRNIGSRRVTEQAIHEAVKEAISRESSTYMAIWDNLSNKKKNLLEALAKSETAQIYSLDFLTEFELGTPAVVQKSIKSLLIKGILEKENGRFLFSDLFFKQWVLQATS